MISTDPDPAAAGRDDFLKKYWNLISFVNPLWLSALVAMFK
jgi:hypothetical protein